MDLRQLLYFTTLAETLNFRRAAERLNMSQPPLTVAIRRLEQELGAALFERSSRGVTLTMAGEAALAPAQATLAQADQVRQAVREGLSGERGRLAIGFVSSTIYALLPRLIPLYRRRFPHVELGLEESTSSEIVDRIRRRELDVGFVRLPLLEPAQVATQVVEVDELMAAVPAGSPFAGRDSIPLRALAPQPFITYPRTSALHTNMLAACHAAGFTPHCAQEASQVPTAISLVQSGLGVGLVPSNAARHVPSGVTLVRLTHPPRIEMGLVLAAHAPSPLAAKFRDVVNGACDSELRSTA